MAKQRTTWKKNPSSDTNLYAYNSADIVYNSARTYNGLVAGEPRSTRKKPRDWSKQ